MTELTDEDKQILDYLHEQVSRGESYFRSKTIAKHIGLSSKQVGARLPKLDEETDDVEIEKWGRARSTTWRVTQG
jgi:DNA-binding Lrp family transcriptional regulator